MKKELLTWKWSWPDERHGRQETHENLTQDNPRVGRDVNREPPPYKSEANLLGVIIPVCFFRWHVVRRHAHVTPMYSVLGSALGKVPAVLASSAVALHSSLP
jgi:hypothetical protein